MDCLLCNAAPAADYFVRTDFGVRALCDECRENFGRRMTSYKTGGPSPKLEPQKRTQKMSKNTLASYQDNSQPSAANVEFAISPESKPGQPNRVPGESSGPATDSAPNPFDPENLRLSQDFASSVGVKKILTTVPCRKPNRHEFIRVRAGEDWRLETGVFEDKINREVYLVERRLWTELVGEVVPVCLFLAINRQADAFLWPAKLPGPDGRTNAWNESAVAAARLAESNWIRLAANMAAGLYDTFEAAGELAKPEWPELTLAEILKLSFRDRFIQDIDHSALRALRGEV